VTSQTVRVLVVDRQPLLRRGVVAVLADEPDLRVVADTDDCDKALELAQALRPDVLLLDLHLAGGGVVACERLRAALPDLPLVVLAAAADDADLVGVVRAGARGYLLRDVTAGELADTLRAVAAGQVLLSPAMSSRLLDELIVLVRRSQGSGEGSGALSPREREVLELVAQGLNNRAIADRLFISENTVKNHVRSIHEKLQVHSRTEAVVRAVRDGLLAVG
jgi:two-component system NarL family response regulator